MSVRDIDLDPNKSCGIGFPLNYDRNSYGFFKQNQKYYQQLQDNIKNLLMTKLGERPGNEEFGCRIHNIVFEQNEPDILQSQVFEAIEEALEKWLPFVTLENVELSAAGNRLNAFATFSSEFNDEIILQLELGVPPEGAPDDVYTQGAGAGGGY